MQTAIKRVLKSWRAERVFTEGALGEIESALGVVDDITADGGEDAEFALADAVIAQPPAGPASPPAAANLMPDVQTAAALPPPALLPAPECAADSRYAISAHLLAHERSSICVCAVRVWNLCGDLCQAVCHHHLTHSKPFTWQVQHTASRIAAGAAGYAAPARSTARRCEQQPRRALRASARSRVELTGRRGVAAAVRALHERLAGVE